MADDPCAPARHRIAAEGAPTTSLWAMIAWRAERTPDAVMAVDEQGRVVTFEEYRCQCERVAAALYQRGVDADRPVAWMLPTWHEAFVVAGALARLGALQVPLLPILREREVSFILERTRVEHVITLGVWRQFDHAAMMASVVEGLGRSVDVIVVDRSLPTGEPDRLPPPPPVPAMLDDGAIRWVFFTSGTTSDPKGVLHSDATVAASARGINISFDMVPTDRNALVFPFTHVGGISFLMGGLMGGYSHLLVESFEPQSCARLGHQGVTISGAGPAFWSMFVEVQRSHPGETCFPDLRALVGGGAAKPATMHDDVRDTLAVVLATGYGLTECPAVSHGGVHDPEEMLHYDGHPLDGGEVRIVGFDGSPAAAGQVGEIRVRGTMLFKGYLDPAHNVDAFDGDGFHRTGDLGFVDEQGLLTVTGRLKDIIIRKGENISAKEVEDVLIRHPGIADVAVIGLPDEQRGERCCAVIVLARQDEHVDLDSVATHCRQYGLARQKTPEQIEIVESLPRNQTGKVLKRELRERLL